jgi:hypothetical protein
MMLVDCWECKKPIMQIKWLKTLEYNIYILCENCYEKLKKPNVTIDG